MRKYYIAAMLLLCGMSQQSIAQGYYLYKNGYKQTVNANEIDSLVFFDGVQNGDPDQDDPEQDPASPKKATEFTSDLNKAWIRRLNFDDKNELRNAQWGLIEATPNLLVTNAQGQEVWNMADFSFVLDEDADIPATVNPSLWRNTQCNVQTGLFRVTDDIYQVRGYDMANMSFIRTKHGWMIFDVLMCPETAKAALELFARNVERPNIVAVLISHSHADHYGGIGAISAEYELADPSLTLAEQIASGKTAIITPAGFMKHVIEENVYCGSAMGRRANYQYGANIAKGVTGRMAMGIGMGEPTNSPLTLEAPTYEVSQDETVDIDGVTVTFQLTPGTEAPSEMNAYFKEYRALWLAENCTGTMHNLYTLRGAAVRDAEVWCDYILEAEQMFADSTHVVFQSHNWPHWGQDVVKKYLEDNAAIYKFIHDQTLYYINEGLTSTEIAHKLELPEKLDKVWYTRQYYGTLSHNIKAVYQKYMGWYDANPVNLNLLTPESTAKKLVQYLGDEERVLSMARQDYAAGEYQWVAQITKELVYANPGNTAARQLCADALEQLGYQSESGTWRNCYLTGALELREGSGTLVNKNPLGILNMLEVGTVDMLLEYAAILTDYKKTEDQDVKVNFIIDGVQCCAVRRSGVVLPYKGKVDADADATVTGTMADLVNFMLDNPNELVIEGNAADVKSFFDQMSEMPLNFHIIEP